jgi:hypothetical protein
MPPLDKIFNKAPRAPYGEDDHSSAKKKTKRDGTKAEEEAGKQLGTASTGEPTVGGEAAAPDGVESAPAAEAIPAATTGKDEEGQPTAMELALKKAFKKTEVQPTERAAKVQAEIDAKKAAKQKAADERAAAAAEKARKKNEKEAAEKEESARLRKEREAIQEQFYAMYPDGQIPKDVADTFLSLANKELIAFEKGSLKGQKAAAKKLDEFIVLQHKAFEAKGEAKEEAAAPQEVQTVTMPEPASPEPSGVIEESAASPSKKLNWNSYDALHTRLSKAIADSSGTPLSGEALEKQQDLLKSLNDIFTSDNEAEQQAVVSDIESFLSGQHSETAPVLTSEQEESIPVLHDVIQRQERSKATPTDSPWGKYRDQREAFAKEFQEMYSPGEPVPPEVLERYMALQDKQLGTFASGSETEQEAVAAEMESFIGDQRRGVGVEVPPPAQLPPVTSSEGLPKEPPVMTNIEEPVFHLDPELKKRLQEATPLDPVWDEYRNLQTREERDAYIRAIDAPDEETGTAEPVEGAVSSQPLQAQQELVADTREEISLPQEEDTPRGWRNKLSATVALLAEKAKEKVGMATERGEHLKAYAAKRSAELGEKAKALGPGAEKSVRLLGERYNKLGWKSKIAIGVGLGIGAASFSGVSALVAGGFGAGLAAQRLAGMAGMYVKLEKHLQDTAAGSATGFFATREWYKKIAEKPERQRKIAAAIMSVGYTAGMSAAMAGAIHAASESAPGHAVHEWLGRVLGHHQTPTPDAHGSAIATPEEAMQQHAPASASVHASAEASSAPAPEASTPAAGAPVPAEMPTIHASKGHGYEYMMKRLWEQLHEKHIELPKNVSADSDLAKLLNAKPDEIDKVVHMLASDARHQFFHDGTSVRIDADAEMTIGRNGELHLSTGRYDYQVAPHHAPVTGASHAEVPAAPPEVSTPPVPPAENLAASPAVQETVIAPVDAAPTSAAAAVGPEKGFLVDSSGNAVLDGEGNAIHTGSYEVPANAAPTPDTIVNHAGLKVPMLESHVYAGEKGSLFVYGGSIEQQEDSIEKYLAENKNGTVFGTDKTGTYRIPFHLVDGKVVAGPPVRNTGLLSFLSSTFMKGPTPDELKDLIK